MKNFMTMFLASMLFIPLLFVYKNAHIYASLKMRILHYRYTRFMKKKCKRMTHLFNRFVFVLSNVAKSKDCTAELLDKINACYAKIGEAHKKLDECYKAVLKTRWCNVSELHFISENFSNSTKMFMKAMESIQKEAKEFEKQNK